MYKDFDMDATYQKWDGTKGSAEDILKWAKKWRGIATVNPALGGKVTLTLNGVKVRPEDYIYRSVTDLGRFFLWVL